MQAQIGLLLSRTAEDWVVLVNLPAHLLCVALLPLATSVLILMLSVPPSRALPSPSWSVSWCACFTKALTHSQIESWGDQRLKTQLESYHSAKFQPCNIRIVVKYNNSSKTVIKVALKTLKAQSTKTHSRIHDMSR